MSFDIDRAYRWYDSTPPEQRTCILCGSLGLIAALRSGKPFVKQAHLMSQWVRRMLPAKPGRSQHLKKGRKKLAFNLRVKNGEVVP